MLVKISKDKQVVNFSIATNDSYKPKGSTEYKQIVTYINCDYWLSAKSAEWLKKGTLVSFFGRIGLSVYLSSEGKAHGSLTFHVNNLKILAFAKKENTTSGQPYQAPLSEEKKKDDLPF